MNDDQLDRALSELPAPRAPRTLLPRVLAAVDAAGEKPAATGWLTWGWQRQAASVAMLLSVAAAAGWLLLSPPQPVAALAQDAGKTFAVLRMFWSGIVEPLGIFVFVIGIVFALVCAAAWAGLEAALGGASQQ